MTSRKFGFLVLVLAHSRRWLERVVAGLEARVDEGVDRAVDAADEEAGDALHPAGVAALARERLQPREVGLGHRLVGLEGEQQRDVDIDPVADERLDGRNPGRRGRHLDHHVDAVHRLPQTTGLVERGLGVVGEVGRDLQADVAVAAAAAVVDRAQDVGDVLDVVDGQDLVGALGVEIAPARQLLELDLVVGRAGDRLLEDGGVGRDTAQAVLVQEPPQLATRDEAPPDVVEPHRLAVPLKLCQRIRHTTLQLRDRAASLASWLRHVNIRPRELHRTRARYASSAAASVAASGTVDQPSPSTESEAAHVAASAASQASPFRS